MKIKTYNYIDEGKIWKIMDTISGNITFIKNEKKVELDSIPSIEIEVPEESADTAPYTTENNRIIKDKLQRVGGRYSYKIKNILERNINL